MLSSHVTSLLEEVAHLKKRQTSKILFYMMLCFVRFVTRGFFLFQPCYYDIIEKCILMGWPAQLNQVFSYL